MFGEKDITKREKEFKELKRENRRRDGFLLIAALQVASLFICYYLGSSSNRKK